MTPGERQEFSGETPHPRISGQFGTDFLRLDAFSFVRGSKDTRGETRRIANEYGHETHVCARARNATLWIRPTPRAPFSLLFKRTDRTRSQPSPSDLRASRIPADVPPFRKDPGSPLAEELLDPSPGLFVAFLPTPAQEATVEAPESLTEETQRLNRLDERKPAALEALKKSRLDPAFTGEL